MLRFSRWASTAASLAIATMANAGAQDLSATEGSVQLPAEGQTSATAFVVVKNPTMYDIYLVSAASSAASEIQIRDARDGEAKTVAEVTIPAYGSLRMSEDGIHLSLAGLENPLEAGDTVTITLTIDSGTKLKVRADVRDRKP